MTPSIIFHYPLPIKEEFSGSQVHVNQMLHAFGQAGYDVAAVTGYAADRARCIAQVERNAAAGRKFDFVFAWSPTVPTVAAKGNLLHPLLDPIFFCWCRRQNIPLGLFYGDVHWRFSHYKRVLPWPRRALMVPAHWYDWLIYTRSADHLFLPSLRMAGALPSPWSADRVSALYPGCNPTNLPVPDGSSDRATPLNVFYVGGIRPPLYDLKPMLDAVNAAEGVQLTLCCRPFEWQQEAAYYGPLDTTKVRVVHAYGQELAQYYAEADVSGLFWRPYPYLDFAMPVKLFESIGYGVPVVITAGIEAAHFVEQEGAGWTVSSADEFRNLLEHLRDDREELAAARRRVMALRMQHTWTARAEMVAQTLTKGRTP